MNIMYIFAKILKKIQISAIKNSNIHATAKIASSSNIVNSTLMKYSYIGNYCTVVDTKIASFCSVSDNVVIGGASHPMEWASTSPVFHQGKNILNKNFSEHPFNPTMKTIIENDVWIGTGALIKSGVKICNGAVVGMGSVVTKDIGEYEIWAGNPAKFIRKRFDDLTIEILVSSRWWELTDEEVKEFSFFINDKEKFTNFLLEKITGDNIVSKF